MEVRSKFDNVNCWTVFSFFSDGEEIGELAIGLEDEYGYIFKISAYEQKKGYGTKMIHYLRSIGITRIKGDADPDSIGFWNSFQPTWKDDSFLIEYTS